MPKVEAAEAAETPVVNAALGARANEPEAAVLLVNTQRVLAEGAVADLKFVERLLEIFPAHPKDAFLNRLRTM